MTQNAGDQLSSVATLDDLPELSPPPPFRKRSGYGPVVTIFTVPFSVRVTIIGLFC